MSQPLGSATQKDFRDDLVVGSAPSFISSDSDVTPVVSVGRGLERPNARQSVKSFLALQNGANTTYWQVATVTANTRIFFLGVESTSLSTQQMYIEDAATGNIAPSDNSTVGLWVHYNPAATAYVTWNVPPRECKMGIRLKVANTAATASWIVVYYMVERIDGQTQDI